MALVVISSSHTSSSIAVLCLSCGGEFCWSGGRSFLQMIGRSAVRFATCTRHSSLVSLDVESSSLISSASRA